jgi:hypothetical protein
MTTAVYSHTDYLDVLNIQTKFLQNIDNKVLLINKNNLDIYNIYDCYDRVIFYDDSLTYAEKLNSSIKELNTKFVLLIHDVDILLHYDKGVLSNCLDIMEEKDLDRIDLQWMDRKDKSFDIKNDQFFIEIPSNYDNKVFLVKNSSDSNGIFNGYIYNVNPSIWKIESLIEITDAFNDKTYRNIEGIDVQKFCEKYKIYKLYSEKVIDTTYYKSVEFFQFLHITHYGMYMPISNIVNKLPQSINEKYQEIIKLFDLENSKRKFRDTLH